MMSRKSRNSPPPLDRETIRSELARMRIYCQQVEAFRIQTQPQILSRGHTVVDIPDVPALIALTTNIRNVIWEKHNGYWASIRSNASSEALLIRRTLSAVHEFYEIMVEHYPNFNTHLAG